MEPLLISFTYFNSAALLKKEGYLRDGEESHTMHDEDLLFLERGFMPRPSSE